jgi:hypothetical protein
MTSHYTSTGSAASGGTWLLDIARRQPEALLLMAAGCALLMRSGNGHSVRASYMRQPEHERGARHVSGQGMGERLSQTAQSAADYAADVGGRMAGTASAYAESVSELAADAGRNISEGSERLARQAQSTFQGGMDRMLRDQPLAVAAIGLAAGAALAAAFPSTEIESRALGGAREALSDAVERVEETVVGAAGKAGQRLQAAAQERGMTAEGIKDLAGEAASAFTEAVSSSGSSEQRASPGAGRESSPSPTGGRSASTTSSDPGSSGRKGDASRGMPRPGGGMS